MSFLGVQFDDSHKTIALVNKLWLTPRKIEVLWPPYRLQKQFDQALKNSELPQEDWTSHKVLRCHFDHDDLEKARRKLRKWEETSDIQTSDADVCGTQEKHERKRSEPTRYLEFDSDDSDDSDNYAEQSNKLPRPPPIKFPRNVATTSSPNKSSKEAHYTAGSPQLHSSEKFSTSVQNCSFQSSFSSQPSSQQNRPFFDVETESDSSTVTLESILSYQKKAISLMCYVKEQNTQILSCLNKQNKNLSLDATLQALPDDLPVQFPLKYDADVPLLEEYLKDNNNLTGLASYLSTLGGRDLTSRTNNVLKYVMTNSFALNYSFFGKRQQKKAFGELLLKVVVIRAVKTTSQTTEKDIENCIKVWLKHAPQRLKKEN